MPTNRVPIARPRRPGFGDEALSLFVPLDGAPPSYRESREFRDQSLRLAEMLDMNAEWWMCQDVLDRRERPCHPPDMPTHAAFHRCRAMRLALLEAAAAYTIGGPPNHRNETHGSHKGTAPAFADQRGIHG
jgi:hypothetical protein